KIHLEYPSVGATEQVLLTAVRAQGITELTNAAVEPEIEDLIAVLQKMGALISLQTDRTITIEGVETLGGYQHTALADRIEARSEEHTSELQSRFDLVCRLLLEKKKFHISKFLIKNRACNLTNVYD